MRYQSGFFSAILFFLISTAHSTNSSNTESEQTNATVQSNFNLELPVTPSELKAKTDPTNSNIKDPFRFTPFNKKNVFLNATALYALMSDAAINSTPYAETATPGTPAALYNANPGMNPGWGYQVTLGYKFDPNAVRFITVSYTNLLTRGTNVTSVIEGGALHNMLTQVGNAVHPAFSLMKGPATAATKTQLAYNSIDLLLSRPMADDEGAGIKFSKELGLTGLYLNKSLSGQYTGLVSDGAVAPSFHQGQDNIRYSADYYGIGPSVGVSSSYRASKNIAFKGGGMASFLAGYYNSQLQDVASAAVPIEIDSLVRSTSFTSNESHSTQAWTPFVFKANVSVLLNLFENKKTGFRVHTETGIGGEYVVATFSTDSYTAELGNPLVRLNNSLNFIYAFFKLKMDLD